MRQLFVSMTYEDLCVYEVVSKAKLRITRILIPSLVFFGLAVSFLAAEHTRLGVARFGLPSAFCIIYIHMCVHDGDVVVVVVIGVFIVVAAAIAFTVVFVGLDFEKITIFLEMV